MASLFSAVDIQEPDLLHKLKEVRDSFDLGFKPVPREKMHITFQFFQNLDKTETEQVIEALDNINISSFKVRVEDVGAFPSQEYIRVVWAGVEDDKFTRLYKQVCSHKVSSDNSHPFKPHITLLRISDIRSSEKRKVQRMLRDYEKHYFGELEVDNVNLFQSKNKEYRKVYTKSL